MVASCAVETSTMVNQGCIAKRCKGATNYEGDNAETINFAVEIQPIQGIRVVVGTTVEPYSQMKYQPQLKTISGKLRGSGGA